MATETRQSVRLESDTPVKPAVQARQGVISGRVLTVLVCSLALAIIALVIGYFAVH